MPEWLTWQHGIAIFAIIAIVATAVATQWLSIRVTTASIKPRTIVGLPNNGAPHAVTPPHWLDFAAVSGGKPVLLNGGWREMEVYFLDEHWKEVMPPARLGPALVMSLPAVKVIGITTPADDVLGWRLERIAQLLEDGLFDDAKAVLAGEER